MDQASVLPIAEKGVAGRGVLIDMARHRGKPWLDKGETFSHTDLEAAAASQGVSIEPHDVLCVRTGWLKYWYELNDKDTFYQGFNEPGLTYSRALVEWFQQREIPNLVTDTIANEVTYEPETGVALPLHCALMRNLGVALTEIAWLDDLADACAADGRWSFFYVAAPLKVVSGTGAPVNPVAIRCKAGHEQLRRQALAGAVRPRAARRDHRRIRQRGGDVRGHRGTPPRRGRDPLLRRPDHLRRA